MKSKTIPGFKERCTCLWSKDNEFGFIPFKECPVHGKQVKESLERMKPYHYVGEDVKCDIHKEDIVDKIIRESDKKIDEIEEHTNKVKLDLPHDKCEEEEKK